MGNAVTASPSRAANARAARNSGQYWLSKRSRLDEPRPIADRPILLSRQHADLRDHLRHGDESSKRGLLPAKLRVEALDEESATVCFHRFAAGLVCDHLKIGKPNVY
jgi:hypothetical protein